MSDYFDRPVYDDIEAEHHSERQAALDEGHSDEIADFIDQADDEERASYFWARSLPRRRRDHGGLGDLDHDYHLERY